MINTETPFVFVAKNIPTDSGCYLYYGKNDELLYVGKAKNIRKRISSYFQKSQKISPKTALLIKKIQRIETQIVSSEMEALILERMLIKQHMPRFNISLRDDKNFVYLRLTKEAKPKMEITRRIVRNGDTYFGPKTSAKSLRDTVRFCQKYFHIGMVNPSHDYYPLAMSNRDIPDEEYQQQVENMKKFLRGSTKDVLSFLENKMMTFATEKNFEAAAKIRDTIQSISASTQQQNIDLGDLVDRDFIHFFRNDETCFFIRIVFREGKIIDQNEIVIQNSDPLATDEDIIESFLLELYPKVDNPPQEIYIPYTLKDPDMIVSFLSEQVFKSTAFKILCPQRGQKKKVLDMAYKNAKNFAEKQAIEAMSHAQNFAQSLPKLKEALNLSKIPSRIECYDISHFAGRGTVGSMVVFVEGVAKTSHYRRFHIQSLKAGEIDDFASLKEVLLRRMTRVLNPRANAEPETTDEPQEGEEKNIIDPFSIMPDLIVIDGGKGQLSTVLEIFAENFPHAVTTSLGFDPKQQVISLAKKEEEIFRPGSRESIRLPLSSPALKLLCRIRDEAHRFAISFNRSVRQKQAKHSVLDDVPGIGPVLKKKLLKQFGSVSGIRNAKENDLLALINKKQYTSLRKML